MFPVCKHCWHDEGDGQNLLIKSRRRREKKKYEALRHTHSHLIICQWHEQREEMEWCVNLSEYLEEEEEEEANTWRAAALKMIWRL